MSNTQSREYLRIKAPFAEPRDSPLKRCIVFELFKLKVVFMRCIVFDLSKHKQILCSRVKHPGKDDGKGEGEISKFWLISESLNSTLQKERREYR